MLKKINLFFLLIIFLPGCSKNEDSNITKHFAELGNLTIFRTDEVTPQMVIKLENEKVFGEKGVNPIGSLAGFAVDKRGRVFIGDDQQMNIHIFDADGTHTKVLGEPGEGPGEFRSMSHSMKIDSGFLYVSDPALMRINVYSLQSLTPYTAIPLRAEQWNQINELKSTFPGSFLILDKKVLLLSFLSTSRLDVIDDRRGTYQQKKFYYKIGINGAILSDKLFELGVRKRFTFRTDRMNVSFSYPFFSKNILVFNNGKFYLARTDELLIKVYDVNGSYLRAFYYPIQKKELTRQQAIFTSKDQVLQEFAKKIQLPETWPVLHSILVDDKSRFWVSIIVNNPDVYEWWVLDKNGKLLARFTWPRSKEITVIKNCKLYVLEKEEETGIDKIVRYDIVFTAK